MPRHLLFFFFIFRFLLATLTATDLMPQVECVPTSMHIGMENWSVKHKQPATSTDKIHKEHCKDEEAYLHYSVEHNDFDVQQQTLTYALFSINNFSTKINNEILLLFSEIIFSCEKEYSLDLNTEMLFSPVLRYLTIFLRHLFFYAICWIMLAWLLSRNVFCCSVRRVQFLSE